MSMLSKCEEEMSEGRNVAVKFPFPRGALFMQESVVSSHSQSPTKSDTIHLLHQGSPLH